MFVLKRLMWVRPPGNPRIGKVRSSLRPNQLRHQFQKPHDEQVYECLPVAIEEAIKDLLVMNVGDLE
jgi:hypothetical protein